MLCTAAVVVIAVTAANVVAETKTYCPVEILLWGSVTSAGGYAAMVLVVVVVAAGATGNLFVAVQLDSRTQMLVRFALAVLHSEPHAPAACQALETAAALVVDANLEMQVLFVVAREMDRLNEACRVASLLDVRH